MSVDTSAYRWNPVLVAAAALLLSSFFLAATSGPIPIRGVIVQVMAIITITLTLLKWRGPRLPPLVMVAMLAVPAVPLLQLVPLPPGMWQALPGREIAIEIAGLAGGSQWRPLSLDPNATLRSFLALLPPLAMFIAACQLKRSDHERLFMVLIFVGLASTFLGALQILFHERVFYLLRDVIVGSPSGIFGNRNHQAIFLCICTLLVYYLLCTKREYRSRYNLLMDMMIALFAGAIFATQSRSGVAILLLLALAAPAYIYFNINPKKLSIGSAVFYGIIIFVFAKSHVVLSALNRFDKVNDDGRYNIWPDVLFSIKHYFPVGAGAGTFTEAFQPFESLNNLSPYYVPRAHNDYLELALEAGIFGAVVLGAVFVLAASRTWRVVGTDPTQGRLVKTVLLAVLALALHSIVDYPVQTVALGSALGMFLGILWADQRADAVAVVEDKTSDHPTIGYSRGNLFQLASRACLLALAIFLAGKATTVGLADAAVQSRNFVLAARFWPHSAEALAGQSEALLAKGQPDEALAIAMKSLRMSSQSSFALRSTARAAAAAHMPWLADKTWAVAARLGWRDGFVQSWVFEQSLKLQDYLAAARAADAMARTDFQREQAVQHLVDLTNVPAGRTAVVESIVAQPPWSGQFFKLLEASQSAATSGQFMAELAKRDAVPFGPSVFPIFERLMVAGEADLVVSMWRKQQPESEDDPRKGLVDSNFEAFAADDSDMSFFGWRGSMNPNVAVELVDDADSGALRLRVVNSNRAPLTILYQLLALRPGSYRFEYAMESTQGAAQDYFWEIRCREPGKEGAQVLGSNRYAASNLAQKPNSLVNFVVPPAGCAAQTLSLKGNGTLDEDSTAEFQRPRIFAYP